MVEKMVKKFGVEVPKKDSDNKEDTENNNNNSTELFPTNTKPVKPMDQMLSGFITVITE